MAPQNNGPQNTGSTWQERHSQLVITAEHRAGQVARQDSENRRGPQIVLVRKAEARARRKDTTVWQERIDQLPLGGGGMFIT